MSAIAMAISLAFSIGAVAEGLPDLQSNSGTGVAGTANADATSPTRGSDASESAAIGQKALRESQTYSGAGAERPAIDEVKPVTSETE